MLVKGTNLVPFWWLAPLALWLGWKVVKINFYDQWMNKVAYGMSWNRGHVVWDLLIEGNGRFWFCDGVVWYKRTVTSLLTWSMHIALCGRLTFYAKSSYFLKISDSISFSICLTGTIEILWYRVAREIGILLTTCFFHHIPIMPNIHVWYF